MRPEDSTIPKFYGLPKVHKENIPLRPIVAFRNSPTYHLASYLAKLLRPLVTDSPHMLQNSADFIERIKGLNLRSGDVLVSFDVQSMFTSIPRDLAKSALKSAMEDNRGFLDNQKLSVSELMRLISLCLDSTYFRFRDHTYHQQSAIFRILQFLKPKGIENIRKTLEYWKQGPLFRIEHLIS
ncbi:uncharacterized protein LOC143028003 [Oratosquilla oratoria]|uniref:uncharacterized protein LOC143028003 n=1 Tax=Oratosquilla oratoria TaxID=337810 RepID=UPI003F75CA26